MTRFINRPDNADRDSVREVRGSSVMGLARRGHGRPLGDLRSRVMRHSLLLLAFAACESSNPTPDPDQPDAPPPGPPGMAALPQPTGTCPAIAAGDVTFAPAGIAPRKVKLAIDPAKTGAGEVVLYWHATGSAPEEAAFALGNSLDDIVAGGGVVAAPYSDASAGTFEWFIVNGSDRLDDFTLADEIVGCLAQAGRVDAARVHSVGMSAGGLQTTAFSFMRSNYVASVATFSGGMPPGYQPQIQRTDNKFAALIFFGGVDDNVFGLDFKAASELYGTTLDGTGHFTALCDHGNGHEIPLDAAPSVTAFFRANPFGAWPSPYANGLPATFPAYCSR
jgi:hypothetical protein